LTALALVFTECVKLATYVTPLCASNGIVELFFGGGPTACAADDVLVGSTMDFIACSLFELMDASIFFGATTLLNLFILN
jgi:hypothetical protein